MARAIQVHLSNTMPPLSALDYPRGPITGQVLGSTLILARHPRLSRFGVPLSLLRPHHSSHPPCKMLALLHLHLKTTNRWMLYLILTTNVIYPQRSSRRSEGGNMPKILTEAGHNLSQPPHARALSGARFRVRSSGPKCHHYHQIRSTSRPRRDMDPRAMAGMV